MKWSQSESGDISEKCQANIYPFNVARNDLIKTRAALVFSFYLDYPSRGSPMNHRAENKTSSTLESLAVWKISLILAIIDQLHLRSYLVSENLCHLSQADLNLVGRKEKRRKKKVWNKYKNSSDSSRRSTSKKCTEFFPLFLRTFSFKQFTRIV